MDQDARNAAHLRRTIKTLLKLNDRLVLKLQRIMDDHKTTEPLPKDAEEAFQTAYKQVMMVGDFEKQLVKHGYIDPAGAGEALDLDAARTEIARRLDRLREAADRRSTA